MLDYLVIVNCLVIDLGFLLNDLGLYTLNYCSTFFGLINQLIILSNGFLLKFQSYELFEFLCNGYAVICKYGHSSVEKKMHELDENIANKRTPKNNARKPKTQLF